LTRGERAAERRTPRPMGRKVRPVWEAVKPLPSRKTTGNLEIVRLDEEEEGR
jgi:hypothetical protein